MVAGLPGSIRPPAAMGRGLCPLEESRSGGRGVRIADPHMSLRFPRKVLCSGPNFTDHLAKMGESGLGDTWSAYYFFISLRGRHRRDTPAAPFVWGWAASKAADTSLPIGPGVVPTAGPRGAGAAHPHPGEWLAQAGRPHRRHGARRRSPHRRRQRGWSPLEAGDHILTGTPAGVGVAKIPSSAPVASSTWRSKASAGSATRSPSEAAGDDSR